MWFVSFVQKSRKSLRQKGKEKMNKLFSKVAALSVGLAMAIGVGIAIGSKSVREARADYTYTETAFASLATNDVVVIVGNNGSNYAMSNDQGNSKAPSAVSVTVSGTGLTGTVPSNVLWKVTKTNSNIEFTVNGGTGKLTCGTANNGMRVDGDGGNSVFSIKDSYIYNATNGRYVGIYSSQDWRCYTSINSNIEGQSFKFFKQGSIGPVTTYTITYDANGGSGEMASTTSSDPAVAACTYTAPSGKAFSKWNTAADGSGTDYAVGAKPGKNLDLYAIWVVETDYKYLLDGTSLGLGSDLGDGSSTISNVSFSYAQAKNQTVSGTNALSTNPAIFLAAESGYIYNSDALGGKITKFELFVNSTASTKAAVQLSFSTSVLSEAKETPDYSYTLSTTNTVIEPANLPDLMTYFRIDSVSSDGKACQIQIRITCEKSDPSKKDMTIYQGDNAADGGNFLWDDDEGFYLFTAKEDSTPVTDVTWSVSSTAIATINASTGALTTVKPGEVTIYAEAEGYNKAHATISIIKGSLEEISVSGSMSKTSYTTSESWSPAGLTVTATYHSGWEETPSSGVTWTYEPASPADGVTSVVATAHYEEETASSTAQTVSVTVMHAGTFADPYTVANARSAIDAGSGTSDKYAIGIVSEIVTDYSTEYKNISFNISTDGLTTSNQLQAFRCVSSTAHTISSNDDVEIGATVIVKGNLKNFHGTYEFDAGCTIESYTAPEKGDIEVTFNPTTSYEVGASATFAATTDPTGATLAWESNDPSVLSVNASTGAFEALGVGVARVTVNATLNDQHGTAFADIVVNGSQSSPYSVNDVLTNITPSLDGTTSYYIYVGAYVKEFATSMSSTTPAKPRAIDVVDFDEESRIMVYTNVDPYEGFVDGLSLGDYVLVKAKVQKFVSGNSVSYQLTQPEKVSSRTSAMAFAFKLLELTDGKCATYVDGKSSYSEFKTFFEGVWDDAEAAYDALEAISGEQAKVLAAEGDENGTVLEQAMARYDLLVAKYGLTHFVTSRAKISYRGFVDFNIMNGNSNMIIVIAVASASILAFAMLLVFKKKKQK